LKLFVPFLVCSFTIRDLIEHHHSNMQALSSEEQKQPQSVRLANLFAAENDIVLARGFCSCVSLDQEVLPSASSAAVIVDAVAR
jgi:hypothetical protein